MAGRKLKQINDVDTTKAITHIGLCAGYGGIELGLKRVLPTLRSVALCEIEAFPIANLVAKMEAGLMDPAPIWTDLKTFPWAEFRDRVDILTGGYPCQPFSAAGKRAGKEDPRHLWPWIADGIRILRPRVCFFENVEGHISLGLREVIGELEEIGYQAAWGIFSAREVNAPHQRKRVFILAVSNSLGGAAGIPRPHQGHEGIAGVADHCGDQAWPSRPGEQQFAWEPPRVVADSKKFGRTDQRVAGELDCETGSQGSRGHQSAPTAADCGDAGIVSDSTSMRLEEQSECVAEREADGSGTGNAWGVHSCEAQEGRPVEHTSHRSNGEQPTEQQGRHSVGGSGKEAIGNAKELRRTGLCEDAAANLDEQLIEPANASGRQTQPPLGRDPDGPADWLDYAELQVSCDNRTDELRLLGNGVVPATAERAFRTLIKELL